MAMTRPQPALSAEWDRKLTKLGGSGLQGSGWAAFIQKEGGIVLHDEGAGWMWLARLQHTPLGSYLYCPYGPTAKDGKAWKEAIASLKAVAQEHNSFFIRVEPKVQSKQSFTDYVAVKDWQPSHTQLIDLVQTEELLRRGLKSGHRNAINGAKRRGLSFTVSSETAAVEPLISMLAAVGERGDWQPHRGEYLRQMWSVLAPLGQAHIYNAIHDGKPVAAAMAFDFGNTRTYLHAGSYVEARTLQAAAPLVWEMVLDAKKAGMTTFDLGGTAPENAPNFHVWAGFTKFKQGFGGYPVAYPGTLELPLNRLRYTAYRLLKKVRGR